MAVVDWSPGAGRCCVTAVLAAVILGSAGALAQTAKPGEAGYGVRFNQHDLEALRHAPAFDIDDITEVFRHVFAALPEQATIYPTENYYYFTFLHDGMEYAGNLRLDVTDRDDGVLHFAYYPQHTPWGENGEATYRPLSRADGVRVSRVADLTYDVAFEGRSVRFSLNDLSNVTPDRQAIRDDERYIGPVFDESGLGFYLLFDEARQEFLFVLNEELASSEQFTRVHPDHPALLLGRRTGFAIYEDRHAPRRILVGVYLENVRLNNVFDGPFDQLPDNFIDDASLQRAIVAKHPELDGEVDRFGGFRAQEGRYLVTPYTHYSSRTELETLLRCADPALDETQFYDCFLPSASE